jgi:DNA invertase Pin-like site-specific DNA recombinase
VKRIVAYYRMSTSQQGQSGLKSQKALVREVARREKAEVVKEYVEKGSGSRSERPELSKALAYAKRTRTTLVVATLDRLARNFGFLSALMQAKVDFVACDNPVVNKSTVAILAAAAEHEELAISINIKAGLMTAKAQGTKLGSARPDHWKGREDARRRGAAKATKRAAEARTKSAQAAYAEMYPIISKLRRKGLSLREIAQQLNDLDYATRRGKPWNPVQVNLVLNRGKAQT